MSTNYKSSQRKCNIYFVAKTQSATILANCLSHLYAITLLNAVYRRREHTHIYALTHSRLRVSNNSRVLRLHNFCALTHMPRGDERAQFTIIVYVHKCSAPPNWPRWAYIYFRCRTAKTHVQYPANRAYKPQRHQISGFCAAHSRKSNV